MKRLIKRSGITSILLLLNLCTYCPAQTKNKFPILKWVDNKNATVEWIDTTNATTEQKARVRAMLQTNQKLTKNKFFLGNMIDNTHATGEWVDTTHATPAQMVKVHIMQNLELQHKKNSFFIGEWVDTTHATPAQMAKVHAIKQAQLLTKDHYYYDFPFVRSLGIRFTSGNLKSEIYEGLNWGNNKSFKSILIQGDCGIDVAALNITEENAKYYKYHVVQNYTTQLVDWKTPSVFKYTADHKSRYAYLGNYKYVPEQVLMIEIYDTRNYSRIDDIMVSWKKVEAANIDSYFQYTSKQFSLPDHGLLSRSMTELGKTTEKYTQRINGKIVIKERPFKDFVQTTSKNDIKFKLVDSLQAIAFDFNNHYGLYNYRLFLKREINGRIDSIDIGEENRRFVLYKVFWNFPGHYTMSFIPKIHKHGGEPIYLLYNLATKISFTVLPSDDRRILISVKKLVAIITGIIFIVLAAFTFYWLKQKNLLAKEAQSRQVATAQLQSVRAQLNPHFIFNALAGIQNLMNKNDIEKANRYLARFARLTRNVLDDSDKELVSIEHETDILTDYLQMEQMRFGFKFSIEINNNDIDQQIEIPTMLLQPFTENAVKHGVSAMGDKGIITVSITKHDNNLQLNVHDNGKGFASNSSSGKGIKLCEDRIALLNKIYKHAVISLCKNWDNNGTLITIELKNWL